MYQKSIPFHDYNGKARNSTVCFNLEVHEVFDYIIELNNMFNWKDGLKGQDRELEKEEMREFYSNFKTVVLGAWGIPSEDALRFEKTGRYQFEESALFAATMLMFFSDLEELNKFLEEMMPKGMDEVVRKQTESLNKLQADPNANSEDIQAELTRLRALALEKEPTIVPGTTETPTA